MNETLRDQLLALVGAKSLRAMAMKAGIDPSKLHRQLAAEVKVETIVQICRAWNAPLLPAFVLAGFITEEEASAIDVESALKHATDRQLVEETLRRVVDGETHPELTEPVSSDVVAAVVAEREAATKSHDVGGIEEHMTEDELRSRYRLAADTSDPERPIESP